MTAINEIKTTLSRGHFSNAISLIEALPQEEQAQSETQYLLAVAQRLQGQSKQAIATNQKILEYNPGNGRAWQELGHCYVALNQEHEAAKHFYKATQLNPVLVASWRYLQGYYQNTGNSMALMLATQQIDWLMSLPKPILGARDLLFEGELQKADAVCRQFLQKNKHHPEAMVLLAEIGIKFKSYSEAEFLLESCITLNPEHYQAGLEYAKLLNQIGKYQQALDCCQRMLDGHLQQKSQDKSLLLAKAGALLGIGRSDESIKIYEQLIELDPEQPFIWLLQGHALKAFGEFDNAVAAYHKACQLKPDLGDAWWSLANTKTYHFTDTELATMTELAAAHSTSVEDKVHLDFALGKGHEHTQQYDTSFVHYQRGNEQKQSIVKYDVSTIETQVANHCGLFTKELFNKKTNSGHNDPAPIFIVGLPRAGSTLLEQILASHSQVEGTMELHNILSLVARLKKEAVYPDKLEQLNSDYLSRFGQQYIKDTRVYRSAKDFFIDKMPNNFLHIGLIKLILPNAKIIDARRNPLDCCFSGYRQLFGEGQEFTYDLENVARYYQAYEKMMTHWNEVLPGFVLHVQHEDVIEDLGQQVEKILKFCNIPFEESCLNFHQTKRTIKTPSSEQVRQPVNRKGMHQWKPYVHHLQQLTSRFKS